MGNVLLGRQLLKLFNQMNEEGTGPYDPGFSDTLKRLLKEQDLSGLEHRDGRLDLIDALRAMQLVREQSEHNRPHIELVGTTPGFKHSGLSTVREGLRELLSKARHSILLLAYRLSDDELITALQAFHAKPGRRLRIIADHGARLSEIIRQWPVDARPDEIEASVYVERVDLEFEGRVGEGRFYPPMHTKTIVVDGRFTYVGSANFTSGGLNLNLELGALIESEGVAQQVWAFAEGLPERLMNHVQTTE